VGGRRGSAHKCAYAGCEWNERKAEAEEQQSRAEAVAVEETETKTERTCWVGWRDGAWERGW